MKETPILFTGLMVKATLEGKKTHTCRTKGLEEINKQPGRWRLWRPGIDGMACFTDHPQQGEKGNVIEVRCPYGVPGDRLWGREAWNAQYLDCKLWHQYLPGDRENTLPGDWFVFYRADGESNLRRTPFNEIEITRWRPSIHMPRWASRLPLEIVNVQLWRVQELPTEIMIKEGIEDLGQGVGRFNHKYSMIRGLFAELWDSINAKRGLGMIFNPWVWGIEYRLKGK